MTELRIAPSDCCEPAAQETCCTPEAKDECCGGTRNASELAVGDREPCGCSAGHAEEAKAIREGRS